MRIQFWLQNPKGRVHFEEFDLNGREISKCISEKCRLNLWTELNWLTIGPNDGRSWPDDKPSSSLKVGDFQTG
jgi:hypothetical protein